jgi:hypothetical protein
MPVDVEFEILKRVLRPDQTDMPAEVAKFVLGVGLPSADRDRMEELGVRANRGSLSPPEEQELDAYLKVCRSLAILQAKAKLSLKAQNLPAA